MLFFDKKTKFFTNQEIFGQFSCLTYFYGTVTIMNKYDLARIMKNFKF